MRKLCLPLSLILALAACDTSQPEQALITSVFQSVRGLGSATSSSPTIEEIRQRLTPEVRAQYGNAPLMIARLEERNLSSVLVQTAVNRDVATYTAPGGVSVSFKQGILVGSRGLGFDLMTADVSDTLEGLRSGNDGVRVHRYLDGEDQIVIESYMCTYRGWDTIVESCFGSDTRFENMYRISSGRIISSRQWVGPQVGYISVEPA